MTIQANTWQLASSSSSPLPALSAPSSLLSSPASLSSAIDAITKATSPRQRHTSIRPATWVGYLPNTSSAGYRIKARHSYDQSFRELFVCLYLLPAICCDDDTPPPLFVLTGAALTRLFIATAYLDLLFSLLYRGHCSLPRKREKNTNLSILILIMSDMSTVPLKMKAGGGSEKVATWSDRGPEGRDIGPYLIAEADSHSDGW